MLPEVSGRLAGAAIAGHNVRFDLGFLRAEKAELAATAELLDARPGN
ncbi:hypothetical protein L6E12_00755 [Actinokineospora sp. PR83]|nr:hypothetical protein [Actinokineospora sp. PR83]MCG8914327.1 hypothetical protein [Actinokineospora sp. PR83]